jgi:hypothetical protein
VSNDGESIIDPFDYLIDVHPFRKAVEDVSASLAEDIG